MINNIIDYKYYEGVFINKYKLTKINDNMNEWIGESELGISDCHN